MYCLHLIVGDAIEPAKRIPVPFNVSDGKKSSNKKKQPSFEGRSCGGYGDWKVLPAVMPRPAVSALARAVSSVLEPDGVVAAMAPRLPPATGAAVAVIAAIATIVAIS